MNYEIFDTEKEKILLTTDDAEKALIYIIEFEESEYVKKNYHYADCMDVLCGNRKNDYENEHNYDDALKLLKGGMLDYICRGQLNLDVKGDK